MNIENVVDKLRQLRLTQMASCLRERFERSELCGIEGVELLNLLLEDELLSRKKSRFERSVRKATFKQRGSLEEVDCSPARGITKTALLQFTQSIWLDEHKNVFITGATGTGKTFLSCAIGNSACRLGVSVTYIRMSTLVHKLSLLKGRDEYISMREGLAKTKVLILDDFGIPGFNARETAEVLELLEDRYLTASTIIVTQLPKAKVHAVFEDPTMADACCDRLLNGSIDILLKGESRRGTKNP